MKNKINHLVCRQWNIYVIFFLDILISAIQLIQWNFNSRNVKQRGLFIRLIDKARRTLVLGILLIMNLLMTYSTLNLKFGHLDLNKVSQALYFLYFLCTIKVSLIRCCLTNPYTDYCCALGRQSKKQTRKKKIFLNSKNMIFFIKLKI